MEGSEGTIEYRLWGGTVRMEAMVRRLKEWIKPWTTVSLRLEEGRKGRYGCYWKRNRQKNLGI